MEGDAKSRQSVASSAMAHWSDSMASILETMTANRPRIQSAVSAAGKPAEGYAWWGQSLSIQEQPSFWIGAPAESWTQLGRLILSSLGVEDASDTDIEATCRDVLAQSSSAVAAELSSRLGETVTSGDSLPAAQPDTTNSLTFTWSLDAGLLTIEGAVVWPEALLARFSGCMPPAAEAQAGVAQPSQPATGNPPLFGGQPVDSMPKLDLRVKFVLGRTTLPLRDIFKLNIGSVVELDRTTTEPSDMFVHGRLLARGQIVVVNGNYGLKILQRPE
jgi:flagellar motor switch protein FliN/FliY